MRQFHILRKIRSQYTKTQYFFKDGVVSRQRKMLGRLGLLEKLD